jgi:hypothetical protein
MVRDRSGDNRGSARPAVWYRAAVSRALPLLVHIALAFGIAACSSDDRDLAAAPSGATSSAATSTSSSSSGSGGAGGNPTTSTSSTASSGSGGDGAGSTSATTSTGSGGALPGEPAKVTIVHGVADANAIRLCFLEYPGASNGSDAPWPNDDAGLAFAQGAYIPPRSGPIPEGVDVRIHVLTGDLSVAAGKTCAEALALGDPAAGTGLLVTPLAVLPAPVFSSGKSLLIVPNGCAGGPGHTDGLETLACGQSYSLLSPTLSMAAVAMGTDTAANAVGLQVVHAAQGMFFAADFRFTPGFEAAAEVPVANALSLGGIAPSPPFFALANGDLGQPAEAVMITYYPNDIYATSIVSLSSMLANGSLSIGDLDDGKSFALVAVGAYPGIPSGPWWKALTYAVVPTDP